MCSSCRCCLWVVVWWHCRSPLPLLSLILVFPPHLLLLLPLSHFPSFSTSPSSIASLSYWSRAFPSPLLQLLYFAFNCCDNVRLVSSPDWNYILAFKKLLSRTRIGPWERKYVSDHLKLLKKIPLTQLCCPTHIFYP